MSRYAKFLIALLPAIIAGAKLLLDGVGDGTVDPIEWQATIVAFVAALGVYQIPNRPPAGQRARPDISEVG